MKKNHKRSHLGNFFNVQILVIMLLFYSTSIFGQQKSITINAKSTPLSSIIKEIESQSGLHFFYHVEEIDLTKKLTVNAQNKSITDVLNIISNQTNLGWKIENDQILLFKNNQASKGNGLINLKGNVKDESGINLPGVSIVVKGKSLGTVSDQNGTFLLNNIQADAVLVFSFVGMKTQEVEIKGKTVINVVLIDNAVGLNEVVAIGYGTSLKKDVTGAISVVTSKEFDSRPTTNMGDALEGKVAGVQISKPNGAPQSGYEITIRGVSTITAGSDPLYIVDGVPTTSINQIEPTDIASISILKDASAAAIYGASGANGVVLITTKRGSNNETKVSFNTYCGIANVEKTMDVLNPVQYKSLMTEMGYNTDWSQYNADTNWQNQVFRTGITQSYQVGVSGGNEKTSFYLSGSYLNQDGIIINSSLEKYSFRVNLDHKVSDFLKLGTSVSYNKWNDVSVPQNGRWSMGNGFLTASPVIGIYKPDATFTQDPFLNDLENPVAGLTADDHGYLNFRFNGNVYAELSLCKDLKFKSLFGIEENNDTYHSWVNPYTSLAGRKYNGIAGYGSAVSFYWITENTLSYNKTIGKHIFGAMVGFVASKINAENSSITSKNFGSDAVHTVNGGSEIGAAYGESAKSNESYLGRLNYSYDDKYLLTANFRADGSSVFGVNHKWGYFPSFSTGWRISQEGFWNQNNYVSDLKIRAGWGQVGNDQIGDYASWGVVTPSANYVIGGVQVPGTALTQMENSDLRWEKTSQTNIGIDAYFFKNRISLSVDYYVKNTSDMLLDAPIPQSVGMGWTTSIATKNIGAMTNKGLEFQVSSKNLTGELKWNTDFNISFNRSLITQLEQGVPILGGEIDNRSASTIAEVGQPLGTFYGYISEGVDPQTGMMKYKDLDNSGDLSDGDKTIIGHANPNFTYGLTNEFNYKGFSFSFFFQGVQGNQILNASRIVTEGMYYPINQLTAVLTRWENPGDITNMPGVDPGDLNHNSDVSSRYIEDGSYLRLKSTTLGYDLPKSACQLIKSEKIHIYITAENLLTITKYSGYDPEVDAYGAGLSQGVDFGSYPQSRTFMFGLNVNF